MRHEGTYQRLWLDYAQKYNGLSDKIIKAGIDIRFQIDLVDALERLVSYRTFYRTDSLEAQKLLLT